MGFLISSKDFKIPQKIGYKSEIYINLLHIKNLLVKSKTSEKKHQTFPYLKKGSCSKFLKVEGGDRQAKKWKF